MKKQSSSILPIVKALNSGGYWDGTTLGNNLNISRAAVWKAIQKLVDYQIQVVSIKGKGYSLLEPLILLEKDLIQKNMQHKRIELEVFESLDSTNSHLKSYFQDKKNRACIAETQTAGRGRFNRKWHSSFGHNIYLSLLYHFDKDVSDLAGLSLVLSLSVINSLKPYGLKLGAKWPNDILYEGQKIGGILIELQAESHGASHAIIGLGLNVNMLSSSKMQIPSPWSSLRKATGFYIDRNELSAKILNDFLDHLALFQAHGFSYFLKDWHKHDTLIQERVRLTQNKNHIEGQYMGINKYGHLLIDAGMGVQEFSSGDVSLTP